MAKIQKIKAHKSNTGNQYICYNASVYEKAINRILFECRGNLSTVERYFMNNEQTVIAYRIANGKQTIWRTRETVEKLNKIYKDKKKKWQK